MKVSVLGIGLIGGSIGLAARGLLGAEVWGWDADERVLALALSRGAIDHASADMAGALEGAAAVFVATPVGILPEVVSSALKAAPADCVVSDVGSTKRMVVRSTTDERFVGGHPLAGAETAGVEHARQDLFDGAIWYLTPTRNTAGVFYERLHRLLSGIGAQPAAIEADTHDRLMASVSHLPHILANVLVAQAGRMVEEGEHVPAAGPSFRDATRVAGANDAIWTDIYLSNRDALMARIDDTVSRLHGVRAMLEAGDAVAVSRWNNSARADRDLLLGAGLAGGAVHELRVSVPNSPGVVAEIALALGRAGVNIVDMALSPSPDNSQGVVALWVRGNAQADRAQELIVELKFPVARA